MAASGEINNAASSSSGVWQASPASISGGPEHLLRRREDRIEASSGWCSRRREAAAGGLRASTGSNGSR
ncbi:hypothetical protein NL676_013534 [Syzygium grande]|nr:hypothetical protein NL676_013534 [Syzygium grande]